MGYCGGLLFGCVSYVGGLGCWSYFYVGWECFGSSGKKILVGLDCVRSGGYLYGKIVGVGSWGLLGYFYCLSY